MRRNLRNKHLKASNTECGYFILDYGGPLLDRGSTLVKLLYIGLKLLNTAFILFSSTDQQKATKWNSEYNLLR